VGLREPSVPRLMALRTDLRGAANIKLAAIIPNMGHTYSRIIMLGANIFSSFFLRRFFFGLIARWTTRQ
jgi:hypothetical protein